MPHAPFLRRITGILSMLAYAGVVAGTGILHAETETLDSTAALESEHSKDCPTVHAGPACTLAGAVHLADVSQRVARPWSVAVSSEAPLTDQTLLRRIPRVLANTVRAPPWR
jgi:hypothetical protein